MAAAHPKPFNPGSDDDSPPHRRSAPSSPAPSSSTPRFAWMPSPKPKPVVPSSMRHLMSRPWMK